MLSVFLSMLDQQLKLAEEDNNAPKRGFWKDSVSVVKGWEALVRNLKIAQENINEDNVVELEIEVANSLREYIGLLELTSLKEPLLTILRPVMEFYDKNSISNVAKLMIRESTLLEEKKKLEEIVEERDITIAEQSNKLTELRVLAGRDAENKTSLEAQLRVKGDQLKTKGDQLKAQEEQIKEQTNQLKTHADQFKSFGEQLGRKEKKLNEIQKKYDQVCNENLALKIRVAQLEQLRVTLGRIVSALDKDTDVELPDRVKYFRMIMLGEIEKVSDATLDKKDQDLGDTASTSTGRRSPMH